MKTGSGYWGVIFPDWRSKTICLRGCGLPESQDTLCSRQEPDVLRFWFVGARGEVRITVKMLVRWQTPTAPAQTQELDSSLGNIARVASDFSLVLGFNLFLRQGFYV